jgi:hypothetical protein
MDTVGCGIRNGSRRAYDVYAGIAKSCHDSRADPTRSGHDQRAPASKLEVEAHGMISKPKILSPFRRKKDRRSTGLRESFR